MEERRDMKRVLSVLLSVFAGSAVGASMVSVRWKKKYAESDDWIKKMIEFYNILNEWLMLKQEGKSLEEYFERNQYKTIAIYGMKELGERLYEELKKSGVKVAYAIDKNADVIYTDLDVITPDENLPEVDVIVVTAVHYFDEIERMLAGKVNYPIISLEDLIYEV